MLRRCELVTSENTKERTASPSCILAEKCNFKDNFRLQDEYFGQKKATTANYTPNHQQLDDDSESIEIVTTPTCNELPGVVGGAGIQSIAANTDICVLHHENEIIDAPDFTILHAPQLHSCAAFDESTEVLMVMYSDSSRSQHACSGTTDSDVEILLSEEVLDSELEQLTPSLDGDDEEAAKHSNNKSLVKCKRRQESATDISSVEGFSCSSVPNYEDLSRTQLLNVIREQAVRIGRLEATLQKYCNTQETLFAHVETLRMEFDALKCTPTNGATNKTLLQEESKKLD